MIPLLVNTEACVRQLVEALRSPKRKVPIVVISQRSDKEGPVIKGPKLQELIGPMGRVHTLSGGVLRFYNRMLDNIYGIEPTGVRMYMPRMSGHDAPARHPVWNQTKVESFESPEAFMDVLREICIKRIEYQRTHTHTQKLLTMEQADAMLQQAIAPRKNILSVKPIDGKHPAKGRAVLHPYIPKPKPVRPSDDAIIALMRRFQK